MRTHDWPSLDQAPRLPDYVVHVRWTDMDVLEHVNNVQYIEFADNARYQFEPLLPEARTPDVSLCEIDFLTALESRTDPVHVVSAVIEGELYQEIRSVHGGAMVTHARVRSVIGEFMPIPVDETAGHRYEHWTRRTDTRDGILTNTALFGIFQEARILALDRGPAPMPHERTVVARNTVRVARPVRARAEPYVVRTHLQRLGRASLHLILQVCDDETVLVEGQAVMVGFDTRIGRSRPWTETERRALVAALPLPAPAGT